MIDVLVRRRRAADLAPLKDPRLREVRRWAERIHPDVIPIGEAARGEIATVAGIVERLRIEPADRRIRALIRDATGELVASWPSEGLTLLPDRGALVRGRLRRTPQAEMLNPRLMLMPEDDPPDPTIR